MLLAARMGGGIGAVAHVAGRTRLVYRRVANYNDASPPREESMKRLTLLLALCIMSGPAFATCKSDAADKKLAGAAKTSHMKKCVGDAVGT